MSSFFKYEKQLIKKLSGSSLFLYSLIRMSLYHNADTMARDGTRAQHIRKYNLLSIINLKLIILGLYSISKLKPNKHTIFFTHEKNLIKKDDLWTDRYLDKHSVNDIDTIITFPGSTADETKNFYIAGSRNSKQDFIYGHLFYILEFILLPIGILLTLLKTKNIVELISSIFLSPIQYSGASLLKLLFIVVRIHGAYVVYYLFLKLIKPKKIYILSRYDPKSVLLCTLCNKLNIDCTELQHGVVYPDHAGYYYHPDLQIYYPKYILLFDGYSCSVLLELNMPASSLLTVDSCMKSSISCSWAGETIVIIGQWSITHQIVSQLNRYNTNNYKVYYKLHPVNEKQQMDVIRSHAKNQNITVINTGDIIDKFKNTGVLFVGSFSTVLIEAFASGIAIAKLEIPESEKLSNWFSKNSIEPLRFYLSEK